MKENAVEKLRNAFEDILRDRKLVVKILSVILILLLAAVMKIHSASKESARIETADAAASEQAEAAEGTSDASDPGDADVLSESSASSMIIFVDIGGAVANPGVYQVSDGTRVYQVVEMAGGLTENADTMSVNQAAFVGDGEKIIIPVLNADGTSSEAYTDAASIGTSAASGLVNINYADKEELKTLNGIGDAIADRIIEYRSSNRFKSKEDIKLVKGIGNSTYEKIKDHITC